MECSKYRRANYSDLRTAWVCVECVECGTEFEVRANDHIKKHLVRCSLECTYKARKGRSKSPEHRLKIGLANKGRAGRAWTEEERLAKAAYMKGTGHYPGKGLDPVELADMHARIAFSNSKPKPHLRGPLNPQWKGGSRSIREAIRNTFEYKQWRWAVFERDDYTCQFCKVRGGYLEADHIKQFAAHPDLRLDVSNGRTLCRPCHRTTDTWGRKLSTPPNPSS